jgi:hypothetical protein
MINVPDPHAFTSDVAGCTADVYLPGPVASTQLSTSRLPGVASALSAAVWNSVSVHRHSTRKSIWSLWHPLDGASVSALCRMYGQVCSPSH